MSTLPLCPDNFGFNTMVCNVSQNSINPRYIKTSSQRDKGCANLHSIETLLQRDKDCANPCSNETSSQQDKSCANPCSNETSSQQDKSCANPRIETLIVTARNRK